MAVPTSRTDLSATIGSNSPLGSETISSGTGPDEYLRAHAAFIRQNYDDIRSSVVSVKDYGAVGNGVADDTTALQAALDSSNDLLFPAGTYLCSGLTQSADYQRLNANGEVRLQKNANGVIFTSSGDGVELYGIAFRGESATPSYTGDNAVFSGANVRLINCGSRWAYARALKCTGSHAQIIGTCDIYQTADTGATGYDIEIGVSGTATLYHELHGIYSSQATGGILLTDVGSATILGGQFGKLKIAKGTEPSGSNGGKTVGARILGSTTIELSGAVFSACQFGAVTVTFALGTSQCSLDASNVFANGYAVVNNGNANNLIVRGTSTGTSIDISYGASAWSNTTKYESDGTQTVPGTVLVPNTKSVNLLPVAGSGNGLYLNMSSSNNATIANATTGWTLILSATGSLYLGAGGATRWDITNVGSMLPQADVSYNIGSSSQRVAYVYADKFMPGAGAVIWTSGADTPEGAVTAPIGSLFTRTNGGANTTLYVKESGTGSSGWVAK
jgi:hypothetical protein